ncbi:MAG: peptide-methionine (S)-S-oxide reductase MsrA [Caulobacteraceae bacterium]|nr:peptide-methionine (S)-S-oxide reductase MsrA [Caulobacteraceae bacterium]
MRILEAMIRLRAAATAALIAGLAAGPAAAATQTAVFAGGCFWSAEKAMEKLPGVTGVVSGYAGGTSARPTYENHDGHLEAVKVSYDPARVNYATLVAYFFRHIDPTDPNGQFCDQGPSYRTAMFVSGDAERQAATAAKAHVARLLGKPVATEVRDAARFWPAEGYHQDFARRNPARYNAYKVGCGREPALKAVWAGR